MSRMDCDVCERIPCICFAQDARDYRARIIASQDLVGRLAKWLERLQFNDSPDCDSCPCCLAPASYAHAADCELALALREAGINAPVLISQPPSPGHER